MTAKLSLKGALRKLARSRRTAVKHDRGESQLGRRIGRQKEEFTNNPPELVWCVGALIVLPLIDWFAVNPSGSLAKRSGGG
jgi:hypothetical protein